MTEVDRYEHAARLSQALWTAWLADNQTEQSGADQVDSSSQKSLTAAVLVIVNPRKLVIENNKPKLTQLKSALKHLTRYITGILGCNSVVSQSCSPSMIAGREKLIFTTAVLL